MKTVDVIVIGAGAAGCFSAIQAGHRFPDAKIVAALIGVIPTVELRPCNSSADKSACISD